MKKKFEYQERRGLPGGPNEMFTYVTGAFSTEGYKRNSLDVNNPYNIIPSGNITMKDVDFPVHGVDNLGNEQMMIPGNDYQFPGDMVFETPMYKRGGGLLTKTMKCNSCGWSWKAADGGNDVSTCHKCGGEALPKAQNGGDELASNCPTGNCIDAEMDRRNRYSSNERFNDSTSLALLTMDEVMSNPVLKNKWEKLSDYNKEPYAPVNGFLPEPVGNTPLYNMTINPKPKDLGVIANTPRIPNYDTDLSASLKAKGRDRSYAARKKLAESAGITDYEGTEEQNIAILKAEQARGFDESKPLVVEGYGNNVNNSENGEQPQQTVAENIQRNELRNVTTKVENIEPQTTTSPQQQPQRGDQVQYRKVLIGYNSNGEPVYDEEQGYRARGSNLGRHTTTQNNFKYGGIPKAQGGVETTEPWKIKPAIDPAMYVAAAKEFAANERKKQLTGEALEAHKRNPQLSAIQQRDRDIETLKGSGINPARLAMKSEDQGTIDQYEEPEFGEQALNYLANPMTTLGYLARGEDLPNFVQDKDNPIDMPLEIINPFAWLDYSKMSLQDLTQGDYVGAGLNALGAIPGVNISKVLKAPSALSKTLRYGELLKRKSALREVQKKAGLLKESGKTPKQLPGSPNAFKSEIDWAKWNKEIPENKKLMEEYGMIEHTAKKNGTWMKNADGSEFKGTPEQFVQQNSENFKKAFGNTKVRDNEGNIQIVNHSTDNLFSEFDINKFGKTDDGFYGKGFYFGTKAEPGKPNFPYGDVSMDSYVNIERPMQNAYTLSAFGRNGKGAYYDEALKKNVKVDNETLWKDKYDGVITQHAPTDHHFREYVTNNPSAIKSATGNNGMFDMTNPIIYQGIDGNFITRPLTMFTKNELTQGNQLYRKIGGAKGLQDLINKGGAQAPKPMKMNSGQMLDAPFFGVGKTPNENYGGIFAVETNLPSKSKYNWSSMVGGTSNYGMAPIDNVTGRTIQNIPLEDLEVYRKKWFSNNYKKLNKSNLEKELSTAELQDLSEKAYKWAIRAYLADQVFNDGDYSGGPFLQNVEKLNEKITEQVEEIIPSKQKGGEYKVKSGDTFYGIANKNNISKEDLLKANPGLDVQNLKLNQSIKLPSKVIKKPALAESKPKEVEETSWFDYINPMNWGVSDRDDDGDFKQAFKASRDAGENQFMWRGTRYSTDLKPTIDNNVIYNPKVLEGLSEEQKTRRQALLNAANTIAKSQGDNESLRKLLTLTAGMESTLGADTNAYGRNYTRGPMSIDDIAYDDLFKIRPKSKGYTATQLKQFEWLKNLGYDYKNMDQVLRTDDPVAGMAAARMVYGRSPKALPDASDSKALYDYYLNYYNKGGVDKHGGSDEHLKRWNKLYNDLYTFNEGGQIDNLTIYKNYLEGVYNNADDEEIGQKIYDKLNRVYYRQAKENNMSVPNYIMTNVIR